MTQTDLISVIVPAYNVEKYLDKCMESLLAQTYTNIEIIIVDDGSSDRTAEIAKKYTAADARCRYLYEKNAGLSAARNLGTSNSRGSYVTYVDSDDYCDRTMIEELYKAAIERHADFTVCGAVREEESGEIISTDQLSFNYNELALNWMLQCYTAPDKTWIVRAWGKLYKRALIEGLSFKEGKLYEDQFYFGDILGRVLSAAVVDAPLYHYVNHAGSIVNRKKTDRDFDAVRGAIYVYNKVQALGLTQYLAGAEGKIYAKMLEMKQKCGKEIKNFPSYKPLRELHMNCLKELRKTGQLKIKTIIRDILLYLC